MSLDWPCTFETLLILKVNSDTLEFSAPSSESISLPLSVSESDEVAIQPQTGPAGCHEHSSKAASKMTSGHPLTAEGQCAEYMESGICSHPYTCRGSRVPVAPMIARSGTHHTAPSAHQSPVKPAEKNVLSVGNVAFSAHARNIQRPEHDLEMEPLPRDLVMCNKRPPIESHVAGRKEGRLVALSLLSPSLSTRSPSTGVASKRSRHPPRKDIYDGPDDEDNVHDNGMTVEAAIDVGDEVNVFIAVDEPLSSAAVESVEAHVPQAQKLRDTTPYHVCDAPIDSESDTEQELNSPMYLRSRSRLQNSSVSSRVERDQNLEGECVSDAESMRRAKDRPMLLPPIMQTAGLEYFCPEQDCYRHSSGGEYGWKRSCDLVNHLQRKHQEIAAKYQVQSLNEYTHSKKVSEATTSAPGDLDETETASTNIADPIRLPTHKELSTATWSKYQKLPDPGKEALAELLGTQKPRSHISGESGYFCPLDKCSRQYGHPDSKPWKNLKNVKRHLRSDHFVLPAMTLSSNTGSKSVHGATEESFRADAGTSKKAVVSVILPASAPPVINLSESSKNVASLTTPPDSPSVSMRCGAPPLGDVETTTAHDSSSPTGRSQLAVTLTDRVEPITSFNAALNQLSADEVNRRYREILEKAQAAQVRRRTHPALDFS